MATSKAAATFFNHDPADIPPPQRRSSRRQDHPSEYDQFASEKDAETYGITRRPEEADGFAFQGWRIAQDGFNSFGDARNAAKAIRGRHTLVARALGSISSLSKSVRCRTDCFAAAQTATPERRRALLEMAKLYRQTARQQEGTVAG